MKTLVRTCPTVRENGYGDGIRRMRVEGKSDDGLSTVTATTNKIDDDRLSQKLRKVKESKVVRKVKFACVIDQWDDGEVPGLGEAQIDEHFERIRMLKGLSHWSIPNQPTTRSAQCGLELSTRDWRRLCSVRAVRVAILEITSVPVPYSPKRRYPS